MIAKPFDPVALPETLEQLWALHAQLRMEAHQREFEALRRAYIGELAEKMAAMQAAASALATEGWDRSLLESLSHLAHRIAGSSGLYRLSALSRSAGALEEIVNRLLNGTDLATGEFARRSRPARAGGRPNGARRKQPRGGDDARRPRGAPEAAPPASSRPR